MIQNQNSKRIQGLTYQIIPLIKPERKTEQQEETCFLSEISTAFSLIINKGLENWYSHRGSERTQLASSSPLTTLTAGSILPFKCT